MDTRTQAIDHLAQVLRPYRLHDLTDVCERLYVEAGDAIPQLHEATLLRRAADLSRMPVEGNDGTDRFQWRIHPDERGLPNVRFELEHDGQRYEFSALKPFTPERMGESLAQAQGQGTTALAEVFRQMNPEDRADTLRYLCEDADEAHRCQLGAERLANVATADRMLRDAVEANRPEAVKDALAIGANVNAADNRGNTALHDAARIGNLAMLRPLLEAQAWVEEANQNGHTPLHIAAAHAHAQVCLVLMANGADPQRVDKLGRTPADLTGPARTRRQERVHEQSL